MTFWNCLTIIEGVVVAYLVWCVVNHNHALRSLLVIGTATNKRIDVARRAIGLDGEPVAFDAMKVTRGEIEKRLTELGLDPKIMDPSHGVPVLLEDAERKDGAR